MRLGLIASVVFFAKRSEFINILIGIKVTRHAVTHIRPLEKCFYFGGTRLLKFANLYIFRETNWQK